MKNIKWLFLIAVVILSGCSKKQNAADDEKTFTLLHTNDHHGRFWHNKYGEYGMAARKTLIDRIRQEVRKSGGSVLLLSGGDINTGVPESDLQDAEPDFKGMKKIGYDAMAIGNHEFDNPLNVLQKQAEWAGFPMLSANIYNKKTGKREFTPYAIFEKSGIKIAVIGLTTTDTVKIGNPEFISNLRFTNPITETKKVINELNKTEKPDIIIAATHMGHYLNGKHGSNGMGDVTLARNLPQGALSVIVGGHSQNPVCMEGKNLYAMFKPGGECKPDEQNGTLILQAHEWGKYVGRADFVYKNGKLTLKSYKLIPVNLKKKIKVNGEKKRVLIGNHISHDHDLEAFLQPYQTIGQEKLSIKIANSNGKLEGDRKAVRSQQTNLGYLIAMAEAKKCKADIGIINGGGVRASIDAGEITYKDVLTVQPFANNLTCFNMKGKELKTYLTALATKTPGSGAFAQFYGLSMVVKKDSIENVRINGRALSAAKRYRVAIPSFAASGGDGYPKVENLPSFVNTGFVDADVLKVFLEENSPIKIEKYAPKGRIVYR